MRCYNMGDYFDLYGLYSSNQESPKIFHKWVAISVILSTLKGRAILDRGVYQLHPNQFITLVAGSAKCRKSAAMGMGKAILNELDSPPALFAQKITPEALISYLKENSGKGLIYASEFSVFIGPEASKSGLLGVLTDLYDCPKDWSYHTQKRGKEVVEGNICINLLAASTPPWLRTSIPEDAMGGGFTSRMIFVYADKPSQLVPYPEFTQEQIDAKKKIIEWLDKLDGVSGDFVLEDEARELFRDWYIEHGNTSSDEAMDGYHGRKDDHVLKVAMAISMGVDTELVIKKEHIVTAIRCLEDIEGGMPAALKEIGSSDRGVLTDTILKYIKKDGRIDRSTLLSRAWRYVDSEELDGIIATLEQAGIVEEEIRGKKRFYKYKSGG